MEMKTYKIVISGVRRPYFVSATHYVVENGLYNFYVNDIHVLAAPDTATVTEV
jgi:hypothetical protein